MLMGVERNECREESKIAQKIANYFENLFTSTSPQDCNEILDNVLRIVSESINKNLTKPVEDLEIKHALFSMNPNKVPGLNGLTPLFYQKFWHIIGNDIYLAVKAFFPF